MLRAWQEREPDHGEARMRLARLLAQRGATCESAEELRKLPFWWPGKRDAQFLEGQAYRACNRAREAEAAWRACVRDDPLHPASPGLVKSATQELVALYMLEARLEDARDVLWQAYAQASPAEQPAVLGTRVRVELERIEPREAAETLARYLAADPSDLAARRALAQANQYLGKSAEADKLIAECIQQAPLDRAAWRAWLQILQDRNDPAALAAAVARLPASLQGVDTAIDRARAAALESSDEQEKAAAVLDDLLERDPYDDEAHFRRARLAQRLGETQRAEHHRARHKALSDARDALPMALADYGRLSLAPAGRASAADAMRQLATLCETLGWSQLADAWRAHAQSR
jgi:predicted Zn-dependent protease